MNEDERQGEQSTHTCNGWACVLQLPQCRLEDESQAEEHSLGMTKGVPVDDDKSRWSDDVPGQNV